MFFFLLSCRSHKHMWECVYVCTCVCARVWRVGRWFCVGETMGDSPHSEYGLFCIWFHLLQIDLPAKQERFIPCSRLKLHCVYVPQFPDPFIYWWTAGIFHILALGSNVELSMFWYLCGADTEFFGSVQEGIPWLMSLVCFHSHEEPPYWVR